MNICVYGSASDNINKTFLQQTEILGKLIAKNGYGLVFGGGGAGVMGACARGAYSENGKIYGVVPSFFNVDGVLFDKCTETIYTETMRERKKTLEELSDVFVVAPGGIGTFDEFFEIFTLQNLKRHNKPIFILNILGYYDGILDTLQKAVDGKFLSKEALDRLIVTETPQELINKIKSL